MNPIQDLGGNRLAGPSLLQISQSDGETSQQLCARNYVVMLHFKYMFQNKLNTYTFLYKKLDNAIFI